MSDPNMDAALAAFYVEAGEMLTQLENSLLQLEAQPDDREELDALFRSAHTIKGSAGLFGLDAIVAFTHHVETALDELRNGGLTLDLNLSSLLLSSRDHIESLLTAARSGTGPTAEDGERGDALVRQLKGVLHRNTADNDAAAVSGDPPPGGPAAGPAPAGAAAPAAPAESWRVVVQFGTNTFRDGFDPLSILGYLRTIGEVGAVKVSLAPAAEFSSMDAESCYIGLDLTLSTTASKATIESAFQFVLEDCALSILPSPEREAHFVDRINTPPEESERIGQVLVESGAVTEREVADALHQQAAAAPGPAKPLGELLVAKQRVSGAVVDAALARQAKLRDGRTEDQRMVRVPAEKLDQLINLVGELVIAGAGANALAQKDGQSALVESTQQLNTLVESVRDTALSMRMVPIGETFTRFRRVVRDVCNELGKQVELELIGTEAELDKSVVEKIVDPLMHLVRNALDHGIERPEARIAAGKPASGRLVLSAHHDSGNVVIEISDDGKGLDRERILAKALERGLVQPGAQLSERDIFALIFAAGFSTAEAVTNLSGRGVGMDVVRRNIESLRGTVALRSQPGQGTTVEIRLPLTLAIIDGFLVRVGRTHLILPLDAVVECVNTDGMNGPAAETRSSTGHLALRGSLLPVVHLRELFEMRGPRGTRQSIVVVRSGGRQAGVVVDALAGEQQTVIKPLGRMFRHLRGISGSTILGSGEVALILDVPALVTLAADVEARQYQADPLAA